MGEVLSIIGSDIITPHSEQTDACDNITFLQTLFADGNNYTRSKS